MTSHAPALRRIVHASGSSTTSVAGLPFVGALYDSPGTESRI
jgi:hypothetical protein